MEWNDPLSRLAHPISVPSAVGNKPLQLYADVRITDDSSHS